MTSLRRHKVDHLMVQYFQDWFTQTHTQTHTNIHTQTHTNIHTHTQTHTKTNTDRDSQPHTYRLTDTAFYTHTPIFEELHN